MAKLTTVTDFTVRANTGGLGARYRPIEVIDDSGGYRWGVNPGEALRLAGDLIIAAAKTGSHQAAIVRLSELVDQLDNLRETR